jgi:hypothetical protein
MSPLPAYRNRLSRQNRFLFSWSADDGEATYSRSGQIGVLARASAGSVVTSTGTAAVAQGQPRWLSTAKGAALLLKPTDETLTFDCEWLQQPLSLYVAGYIQQPTDGTTATRRVFRLGSGVAPSVDLIAKVASGDCEAVYVDGASAPASSLTSGNPVLGDYVELLLVLDAARKIQLTRAINEGAAQVGALSAAGAAFAGGYAGSRLRFADGSVAAAFAYRQVRIAAGSAMTLDDARTDNA